MKKKMTAILAGLILLVAFVSDIGLFSFQEKQKTKKEEKVKKKSGAKRGVQGGVQGGVSGGVQGGVVGGVMPSLGEEYYTGVRKMVEIYVEHLEIRPAETIPLGDGIRLLAVDGKKFKYSYSHHPVPKGKLDVEITPVIIENKGIKLDIQILFEGKILKKETVITKNLEPIIIELMESKSENFRLADKLTPFIKIIEAKPYPQAVQALEMKNALFFWNDELLTTERINSASVGGSQVFLYFFIKGKGLYFLSFNPFAGAEVCGFVEDNIIKFKHEEDRFEWISIIPILPEGKWQVWLRHRSDYDPVTSSPYEIHEEDKENTRKAMQQKKYFYTGVASGKGVFKKYFEKE